MFHCMISTVVDVCFVFTVVVVVDVFILKNHTQYSLHVLGNLELQKKLEIIKAKNC